MLLEVEHLNVNYSGVNALYDINIKVMKGKITTIIGANGAGKSSLVNTISGVVGPGTGLIMFEGKHITSLSPAKIVSKGIVQVPEGRLVFPSLTVEENLLAGAFLDIKKESKLRNLDFVFDLFPILKERIHQKAGTLSGGEQQMLALGRGLMSNPKLLMLDEPSLGLAPNIIDSIYEVLNKLKQNGLTILLVEQNAHLALKFSEYSYVLEVGKIVAQGNSKDILNSEQLNIAYLGD